MASVTPQENDVLFGRGHSIYSHPGNAALRSAVRERRGEFVRCKRCEKRAIARGVVDGILKAGGRFLTEDPAARGAGGSAATESERRWIVCADAEDDAGRVMDKVMHLLRGKEDGGGPAGAAGGDAPSSLHRHRMTEKDAIQPFQATDTAKVEQRIISSQDARGQAKDGMPLHGGRGAAFPAEIGSQRPPIGNDFDDIQNDFIRSFCTDILRPVETVSSGQQRTTSARDKFGGLPSGPRASPTVSGSDGPPILQQSADARPPIHLMGSSQRQKHDFLNEPARGLDIGTPADTSLPPADGKLSLDGFGGDAAFPALKTAANANKLNNLPRHHRKQFSYSSLNSKTLTERFPLSVVEFLKSDCLSSRIVLLRRAGNEETIQYDDGSTSHQRRQRLENSNLSRLALLLAYSFLDHLPEMNLASIKLDDFWVDAERDLAEKHTEPGHDPDHDRLKDYDLASNKSSSRRAHLRISFVSQTRTGVPQKKPESDALRILGELLYSVFSRGKSFPSRWLQPKKSTTEDTNRRSSKASRVAESSIFSKLIESDSFPLSICRLISDMVDTGPNGRASRPFDSLDAAIRDLEHMTSRPESYLHDPRLRGVPMQPIFGQAYHGRERDINAIRRVAVQMEQSSQGTDVGPLHSGCLDAVFVSGIAGSGKSHLVQAVEDTLGPGWTVVKAKFERGREHASRRIVSSMFDRLILNLVNMKEGGNRSGAAYSRRASDAILKAVGCDALPSLFDFLPSLSLFFGGLGGNEAVPMQAEDAGFRLVYSISKIIEALLEPGQLIMICCDDLQWADKTSLSMMSDVLINISSFSGVCSRCLYFGLFRHDEIDDSHPFKVQFSYLQMMTSNIKVTEIKLSSLSKSDVSDMVMAELRLPRRYVAPLADAVHKKTSGHALFVVELLNSLLRSSAIVYSSRKRRYDWDQETIDVMQPGDGVAGLIASNLKSLPPTSQRVLQILSCFGIQTDISLLKHLELFQEGIIGSLDAYVEMGILDRAGPIVIFTHDLIQQGVYELMSLDERQKMHLEIGLFLGGRANIDNLSTIGPLSTRVDQLQLDDQEFCAGRAMTSSLISLACDQIDSVGLDMFTNEDQRVTFAKWNLSSGIQAYNQSNPHAAFYYFSKGISFLGEDCWHAKHFEFCLALHKGAIMSSFALGEPENVAHYAKKMTSNSNVKIEDSLDIQPVVLRSLSQATKHEECISEGINVLRQINFDVPPAPSPESLMVTIATTDSMVSKLSMDQIMNLCEKTVDNSVHRVVQIIDAICASCIQASSPFMPFVACAAIQFSLHHGICHESTTAFALFGLLKIMNKGDYIGGKYWADVVRAIVKKHTNTNFRSSVIVYITIDIWFVPPRVIAEKLVSIHEIALRKGLIDSAMISLQTGWRFRLLGGEHLSLVYQSSEERLRLMAKHSQYAAKAALLDSLLLMELTGKPGDYFSAFDGSICNMEDLQDSLKSFKDLQMLQSSHVFNALIQYWRGNYIAAEEASRLASLMLPASRTPSIYLISHTLFRGLILFRLYRTHGGEERLKDGKEMMDRMEKWALVSMALFENKWLLLKAEYCSAVNDCDQALQMYEGSIKCAQDHGYIHELALAYGLLGKFHSARGSRPVSNEFFKNAYVYYTQWGATAVAEKVLHDHNLDMDSISLHVPSQKNKRQLD